MGRPPSIKAPADAERLTALTQRVCQLERAIAVLAQYITEKDQLRYVAEFTDLAGLTRQFSQRVEV